MTPLGTEYKVIKSPWPDKLPDGTVMVQVAPRPSFEHLPKPGYPGSPTLIRKDKKRVFDHETDGKVRLHPDEIELIPQRYGKK